MGLVRLVLYGNLRQGEPMNGWLPKGSYKTVTISGLKMYNLGDAPGVIFGNSRNKIVAEIFEVKLNKKQEKLLLVAMDRIEGSPYLYQRTLIELPEGPAWIYVFAHQHFDHPFRGRKVIKDWKEDKRGSNPKARASEVPLVGIG